MASNGQRLACACRAEYGIRGLVLINQCRLVYIPDIIVSAKSQQPQKNILKVVVIGHYVKSHASMAVDIIMLFYCSDHYQCPGYFFTYFGDTRSCISVYNMSLTW